MFAVRVSPGGPTAAPDAPPASDNAPATPNTVVAFVRPFRFEFRLPCDMVGSFPFHPHLNVSLYANDGHNAAFERWIGTCGAGGLPMSALCQKRTSANSFDHFVGDGE